MSNDKSVTKEHFIDHVDPLIPDRGEMVAFHLADSGKVFSGEVYNTPRAIGDTVSVQAIDKKTGVQMNAEYSLGLEDAARSVIGRLVTKQLIRLNYDD